MAQNSGSASGQAASGGVEVRTRLRGAGYDLVGYGDIGVERMVERDDEVDGFSAGAGAFNNVGGTAFPAGARNPRWHQAGQ